jgi:phosphoglycolate phosphatase-like HAD superfamily hydrolase
VRLLLFDIDGTLILTGGAGLRALDRALCQVVGIVNALDGLGLNGKTDPAIIREVFDAQGRFDSTEFLDRILETYEELLRDEVAQSDKYIILPGIYSFLQDFHSRDDLAIGLATGNIERGARIKLARGDLNRYFPFGGFGSDSESRTELVRCAAEKGCRHAGRSIDPRDTFVIGDTPRDVHAGRQAGFRTVGVATSTFSREDLLAAGADLALSDFERDRDQFLNFSGIL